MKTDRPGQSGRRWGRRTGCRSPGRPTEPTADGPVQDPVHPDILQVYPGDESGPFREQYLTEESASHAELETPEVGLWPSEHIPPPYLNKRWADEDGWFRYELPVEAGTAATLRLSMITKGEVRLEVAGEVVLDTGNSGEGDYTPREFVLDDPAG